MLLHKVMYHIYFSDPLLAVRVLPVSNHIGDAVAQHRNTNGILILTLTRLVQLSITFIFREIKFRLYAIVIRLNEALVLRVKHNECKRHVILIVHIFCGVKGLFTQLKLISNMI